MDLPNDNAQNSYQQEVIQNMDLNKLNLTCSENVISEFSDQEQEFRERVISYNGRNVGINSSKRAYKVFSFYLVVSVLALVLSIIFQGICSLLSDNFYKSGEAPLHDRIHELVGGTPPKWASPFAVNFLCFTFILVTFVRFIIFENLLISMAIFTRIFWSLSIMYIIRGFAITITTLPCPIVTCVPLKAKNAAEAFKLIFEMAIGVKYECTDLIISGHTLFTTCMLMTWIYYNHKYKLPIYFACIYSAIIYFFIDVSFFHYTIDIFLAIILSTAIWLIYHLLIEFAAEELRLKIIGNLNNKTNSSWNRYNFLMALAQILAILEGLEFRLEEQLNKDFSKSKVATSSINSDSETTNCDYQDERYRYNNDEISLLGRSYTMNSQQSFLELYQGKGCMQYDSVKAVWGFISSKVNFKHS